MNIWQGNKIRLRGVEAKDLDGYFCKDETVDSDAQRAGDRNIFPVSKLMMEDRVNSLAKNNPFNDEYFLIIEDLEGNAVGNINTHSCNRIDGTFQYGLGVKKQYRGNGYATEAIQIVLKFYFLELGFRKIETKVYGFNQESIKLHEKLGFSLEGKLRKSHFAKGEYHDILCFGMLKEEFEAY